MRSFKEFLIKSRIDEELNNSEEEIFSIMEDGKLKSVDGEFDDFTSIANDAFNESICEGNETDEVESGFGGEIYVNLDFPQLMNINEAKKDKNKKEDSATIKTLTGRKETGEEDFEKVIARNTKYALADDGNTILKRDPSTGDMKPLTPDQIDELIAQRNKNSYKGSEKIYSFDSDNNLIVTSRKTNDSGEVDEISKILPKNLRKRFLKILNDKVNGDGIHYRFSDDGSKMLVNTTSWTTDGDEDVRDKDRFNNAEYKNVETDEEKAKILSVVNSSQDNDAKKKKPKKVLGYNDGTYTLDGKPMTKKELEKLVISINGNVGGTSKLLNPKGWGQKTEDYWKCYKISIAGSKIGDAVNFNLPPVVTCNKNVPCIREGCYAIKAYGLYPSARAAMDCNLSLLKNDEGFNLFKKSMKLALSTTRKNGDKKFSLCRIHVNGDIISKDYLDAICDIASSKECGHVKFWMYTKQYEILSEYTKKIPDNLCIIVSCWGKFNPFDYKNGKYKNLATKYPLAYLDDESDECKELNQKIQETLGKPKDIQVCPCTEAEEIITRCESCKICFDRSLANNNLVFKKH